MATASEITTVDGLTNIGDLDGSAITDINGTAADVKTAFDALATGPAAFNVDLSGVATAAEITTVDGLTNIGDLDGSAITDINGTAADVQTAHAALDTKPTDFDAGVSGVVTLTDVNAVAALANITNIDGSAITDINGTAADVKTAFDALATGPAAFDVDMSGVATAAQINIVDGLANVCLLYTSPSPRD